MHDHTRNAILIMPVIFARFGAFLALFVLISPTHAATLPHPTPPQFAATIALPGSVSPSVAVAGRRNAVIGGSLSIAISLHLRNEQGLHQLLHNLYTPTSPQFHQFLSPQQFAARFAPDTGQIAAVRSWLRAEHLRVTGSDNSGLLLTVQGSVPRIERTFGTTVYKFAGRQQRFEANITPIRIPVALAGTVVSVDGLNTLDRMVYSSTPLQHTAGNGPDGLWPPDVAALYNLKPLYERGITGKGQTIALVQFSDFDPKDIAHFDKQFGIVARQKRINVRAGIDSGATRDEGQSECEMDIEITHAVAPDARVLVYEAPNTADGAVAMLNRILNDHKATIISTSWGRSENHISLTTIKAEDQLYQQAAAEGIAVFGPSGDNGAFDNAEEPYDPNKTQLAVDFPASDPWVTGVGGTSVAINDDGTLGAETAWSDGSDPSNPVGSGGGVSGIFSRPDYQSGPGVANSYSNGKRQVPDIAAEADPNSGYAIYSVDQNVPDWQVDGGTSAAVPLWAGLDALLNQAVGQRLGFLNPLLYRLGQATNLPVPPFHDITTGDNLYYKATPGWDYTTGWGTPDGTNLARDVAFLLQPTQRT